MQNEFNRFKEIFEHAPVGIFQTSVKGQFVDLNDELIKILGYDSKEDIISSINNLSTDLYVNPKDREMILDQIHGKDSISVFEVSFKRKDAEIIHVRMSIRPYEQIESGERYNIGIIEDITSQKKYQKAYEDSRNEYKALFETSYDAISVWDGMQLLDCNQRYLELFGVTEQEKHLLTHEFVHPQKQPDGSSSVEKAIELVEKTTRGVPQQFEWVLLKKDRTPFYADITLTKISLNGSSRSYMAIVRDITEKTQAKQQLQETKNLLQNILNTIPVAVYWKDQDSRYLGGNQAFLNDAGLHSLDELKGKSDKDLPWKNHVEEIRKDDTLIFNQQEESIKFIEQIQIASGNAKWVLKNKVPLSDVDNKINGVLGCYLDVSTLKTMQEELEKHRDSLEALVEERTREILQLNEELKTSNEELFLLNDRLKNQATELKSTVKKLKSTQEQLLQSEKMASIGFLTAGIAHEINNPVNFISSGLYGLEITINHIVEILKEYTVHCDTDPTCRRMLRLKKVEEEHMLEKSLSNLPELLKTLHSGVDRTTQIVKGLRTFSRLDSEEKSIANVNEILEAALIILHNKYKNRITIERDYDEYPDILCFPGKLSQVALNLIMNAVQAIPGHGLITVKTKRHQQKEFFEIIITDTGVGISKENQRKIFDPFFTTKPVGTGTGIGLSIVHGIIQDHGGMIKVKSEPGKGTTFTIMLPLQ